MHLATKPGAGPPDLVETDLGRIGDHATETFTSSQRRAAGRRCAVTLLTDNQADTGKWPAQNKWNSANRNKLRAHQAVRVALRKGTVMRGKCVVCGSLRTEAHHPNYAEPLVVEWRCRKHHQQLHSKLRKAAL